MNTLSFNDWHEQKLMAEGPRTLDSSTSGKLQDITDQIDAQMQAIGQQVQKLQMQYRELAEKKNRLIKGMGGGWAKGGQLLPPNDFMNHYDTEVGRRPDATGIIDYGSTKQKKRRADALQNAEKLRQDFNNPAAATFFQRISRAEPGSYPVPKNVSPQEADQMVKMLIGSNSDYEDFEIYKYDPKSHSILHSDPEDI
jgi:hypothetical protein